MNVCQRNVARFGHVECMFDKVNDIFQGFGGLVSLRLQPKDGRAKCKQIWTNLSHWNTDGVSSRCEHGRCLLLLTRTCSAHHASSSLSARALGLTLTQSTTPSSTRRLKLKQNFPTVIKSSLMSLYLNQEHQKRSI